MQNISLIEKFRKSGKRIGFTASTFDLLHAGHILMLEESKSQCDLLVVGLLSDPTISRKEKNPPIQSMVERWIQLQAVKSVDVIIPFQTEEDLVEILELIRPNVRFVGEEYRNLDHTGKNIEGIEIIYNSRKHKLSSSELRRRIRENKTR